MTRASGVSVVRAAVGVLGLGIAALGLSACNGPAGSVAPQNDTMSKRLGNLLAFNSVNAPPAGAAAPAAGPRIDCPLVQIDPDASSFRSAAGEGAAGVRYQISIGEVARECALQGSQLAIRVGAEINTLLGPAGAPGSYTTPLRVAVRRQSDEAIVSSKVYRVGGTVGANGQAQATLIADALTVPYVDEHAAETYEIVLGFGEGAPSRRSRR